MFGSFCPEEGGLAFVLCVSALLENLMLSRVFMIVIKLFLKDSLENLFHGLFGGGEFCFYFGNMSLH